MVDKKLYNKDSIESLSPLEFTRLRPQVYAGDCTYSTQLLVEIISNAVDEFRLGHGNKILVTVKGTEITVEDLKEHSQELICISFKDNKKNQLYKSFYNDFYIGINNKKQKCYAVIIGTWHIDKFGR